MRGGMFTNLHGTLFHLHEQSRQDKPILSEGKGMVEEPDKCLVSCWWGNNLEVDSHNGGVCIT